MVLNVGHTVLFIIALQYLTLGMFKKVFLYKAYNDIPCPFPLCSGEYSPDWLGDREMEFTEIIVCLQTLLVHLEIKLYL